MTTYTQTNRLLAISTLLGPDKLLVRSLAGCDGLSQLFRVRLDLLSTDLAIDFEKIIGKNVTVCITGAETSAVQYLNGYISSFAQITKDDTLAHYQAEMVPWLWFLTRTADCAIFQNKSIPEIIEQVFRDHGFFDFKWFLHGQYPAREYCVQYRETACNFVMRLMEQEGIFFFFEHENGRHTLVMADSPGAHKPSLDNSEVRFDPSYGEGHFGEEEAIYSWKVEHEVRSGKYTLTDFNPRHPAASLLASCETVATDNHPKYEVFDYPGRYGTRDEADRYVRIRMEEEEAVQKVVTGESGCRSFRSGFRFTLRDHEREDQNQDYVLVSVVHDARQGGFHTSDDEDFSYTNKFTCIPFSTPFRPPRRARKPVVRGTQTALIVGPEGEEIYTDNYGRVKVRFHWDHGGGSRQFDSCWIRVSQPWAGAGWGAMSLPRIGQEVIVDFLEGDPDQPIIIGRVYNGKQMPPYELPAQQTKTTIKSRSSKGGGGFNELRFEDKKGDEQVFLHAERNFDVRVKKDTYETIGEERHLIVKKNNFERVENNSHIGIANDLVRRVGRDHHVAVGGKQAVTVGQSSSLKVTGDVIEMFQMNHSEQVGLEYYLRANQVIVEALTGITLKCGASAVVIDPSGVTITGPMITIDGEMVRIASGPGSPALSGTAGQMVPPSTPTNPFEADKADPGEMARIKQEELKQQKGKYGSVKFEPFRRASAAGDADRKKSWIEIELKDEAGQAIAGEAYRITVPDGSICEGTLDEKGLARIDSIDPGNCEITFPNLDEEAWDFA